jgi:hypothetical protein
MALGGFLAIADKRYRQRIAARERRGGTALPAGAATRKA